jgi:toxin ParE1/3/4
MNRYRLARQAELDLEDIFSYWSEQDAIVADQRVAAILNRLPMLAQFPDIGRARDQLLPGLRSFPCKPYILFYTKLSDGIEILRVLHQSRDFEGEWF